MNFYVPTLGDKIYLEDNWHFTLHRESRNQSLAERLGIMHTVETPKEIYKITRVMSTSIFGKNRVDEYRASLTEEQAANYATRPGYTIERLGQTARPLVTKHWHSDESEVFLPLGTCLAIDRIYIRKNRPNFDSITFRVISSPDKKLEKARFWVRLADANKIVCSLYPVHDIDSRARLDQHHRFSNLELE